MKDLNHVFLAQIAEDLEQDLTWIEISKENIKHNIRMLAEEAGHVDQICAVVKGDAYGHGIDRVVPAMMEAGVRKYAVYHPEEAIVLRRLIGEQPMIILLGYMAESQVSTMVNAGVECLLLNRSRIAEIHDAIPDGKELHIHLKVDTGMNRFGLQPNEIGDFVMEIQRYPKLKLTGVASHFANSWDIDDPSYAEGQIRTFEKALTALEPINGDLIHRHMSNTAAVFVHPKAKFSFVRTGIGLFGYYPNARVRNAFDAKVGLKPVLSFYSTIVSVKEMEEGEYAGYDIAFRAKRKTRIALAPVGYSDGFPFAHSGQSAYVLIHGQKVPLVGRVNMNTIFMDITDVPDVQIGDRVTLLGRDKEAEVSVWDWVEWGTPHLYEALTKLRSTLPRHVN